MTKNISTLKAAGSRLTWINIVQAQKKEIEYLKRKFKFNDLDLKDSFASQFAQRPKFYRRSDYAFLILQFPIYNQKNRQVEPEEIDFFIGKDFVITAHNNHLPPLVEIFNLCENDEFYRNQYLAGSTALFVYELIIRLQEYCYPMLDHISLDIKNIEQNIFASHERRMVTDILFIKRNILNFRKIIEAHKTLIHKILTEKIEFFPAYKLKVHYQNLIEHAKNIWETLEGQKQIIEALEDTNTSLLTFKLNDIMRTLTIFSVIILPLSLVAGVFGMNTTNAMPFMKDSHGFWLIILIMLTVTLTMLLFFKRKKWL